MTTGEVSSSEGRRPVIGIVLLLLYAAILALSVFGLAQVARAPSISDADLFTAGMLIELKGGVRLTVDERRSLIKRETNIALKLTSLTVLFFFLPLLTLGLRFLTGPCHALWSWQQSRMKRHPIIAYPFLFIGIAFLRVFLVRVLNPANALGKEANLELFLAPILALICLLVSLWLYIGRKKKDS